MSRPDNQRAIGPITPPQIGRGRTDKFLEAQICPQSASPILRTARTHFPFLHLQLELLSISHPVVSVPANQRSPLFPVSHRPADTVSANDIGHDAVDLRHPSHPHIALHASVHRPAYSPPLELAYPRTRPKRGSLYTLYLARAKERFTGYRGLYRL